MGFVSKIASETVWRVTGRAVITFPVHAKERYVRSKDKRPRPTDEDVSNCTQQTQLRVQPPQPSPPPPPSQTLPPAVIGPLLSQKLLTPEILPTPCSKGWYFKEMIKSNWKYLVVVILLSATFSMIVSLFLRDRGIAVMPIFIYPGFMLSGCSFLIGSRGKSFNTANRLPSTTKPEEQKKDQLAAKSERSMNDMTVNTNLLGQVDSEKFDELVVKSESSMDVIHTNENNSASVATAPPPPPPPPSPAQSFTQLAVDCRKLSWDAVGRDTLSKGTVWSKMPKPLKVEEIIDVFELGHLFGLKAPIITTKAFKKLTAQQTIMGTKKKLNISISLAHSKLSSQAVVDGLLNGKGDLSTDLLENLLKFAPNDIEESALKRQGNKDISFFCDVETLFYKIITKIPTYKERIRTMLLTAQLQERMNHIQPYLETIIAASIEVRESGSLRQLLLFVLTVGNYMNKSKTRGFKLSLLSKLTAVKSNVDKNKTFLDFVVRNVKVCHPKTVDMVKEMRRVTAAAKINFKHVISEIEELNEELELLENDVKMINKSKGLDKTFKDNIKKFVSHAQKEFQSLVELKNIALGRYNETLEYFGEEPCTAVMSEQFFGNISTFLVHFEESLKKQSQYE